MKNDTATKCTKPLEQGEVFTHPSFDGTKTVGAFFGSHDDGPHLLRIDVTKEPVYVLAEGDGAEYLWSECRILNPI